MRKKFILILLAILSAVNIFDNSAFFNRIAYADEISEDEQNDKTSKYDKIKDEINFQKEETPDSLLKSLHFSTDSEVEFKPDEYIYTMDVSEDQDDLMIKAEPQYKSDEVYINGVKVDEESTYRTYVDLNYGKNIVTIEVNDSITGETTYYLIYIYRGGEKYFTFNNVKMDSHEIGFDKNQKTYNIELDEDTEYTRLSFKCIDKSYAVKINDKVLNEDNTIKLKFSGINKYTINAELIDKDSSRSTKYTFSFYVGIPVSPDPENSINSALKANQWVIENGRWRYNDSFGKYLSSCWFFDNHYGKYFYFNKRGYMTTGWLQDKSGKSYYLGDNGAMQTGWVLYNDKWYYLNDNGVMQCGWIQDKNKWYYLNESGEMEKGWIKNKGKWYYLNKDGSMRTGWIIYKKEYYYLGDDGAAHTGWTKYNNNWYYMDKDSAKMISGTWMYDSGNWYYINYDGTMRTGWLYKDNKYYYLNKDGTMNRADKVIEGYMYLFNKDGSVNFN